MPVVLAIRNPHSVLISLRRHYRVDPSEGELLWLLKNSEAIRHTGARVFCLRYEQVLSQPAATIARLSKYLSVSSDIDLCMAGKAIRHDLDRSSSTQLPTPMTGVRLRRL